MAKSQKVRDSAEAAPVSSSTNPSLSLSDTGTGIGSEAKSARDPRVGSMLGKYRVIGRLGKGGMGVVYEAEDTTLKRRVAVKLLPDAIASEPTLLERFLREAQAAARLNHPNAVGIYEIDQQDGTHYIVMELVPGGSAEDVIRGKGAYEWREASRIIAEACRGLKAAHEAGLIHRDLKPANIMCGRSGSVKLADFGLAKASDGTAVSLTGTETIVGTPNFMSPEQCRGEKLDARSDIYSLGATYYTLLTGKLPYTGEGPLEVMFAHCSNPIPDPRRIKPDIPEEVADIVKRALAKEPADRFDSAAEMFGAIKKQLTAAKAAKADPTMVGKKAAATMPQGGKVDTVAMPKADKLQTAALPKRRRQRRIPRWAIAVAAATALVATAAALLLPGRLKGTKDQSAPSTAATDKNRAEPLGKSAAESARPAVDPAPPAVGAARILVVIPFRDFWFPDYDGVRRELDKSGAKVTVASSQTGQATPAVGGQGTPVSVDVRIADAKAGDYDSVIFSGGTPQSMSEFMLDQREGPAARRLIDDMKAANKPLAAICAGPAVLARHEALQGKQAVCHPAVEVKIREHGGSLVRDKAVVVDGNVVTGKDWNAAEEFVQALLTLVKK